MNPKVLPLSLKSLDLWSILGREHCRLALFLNFSPGFPIWLSQETGHWLGELLVLNLGGSLVSSTEMPVHDVGWICPVIPSFTLAGVSQLQSWHYNADPSKSQVPSTGPTLCREHSLLMEPLGGSSWHWGTWSSGDTGMLHCRVGGVLAGDTAQESTQHSKACSQLQPRTCPHLII